MPVMANILIGLKTLIVFERNLLHFKRKTLHVDKKIDEQNENRKLQEIDTYNYEGKLQRMAALVKEFCQMDFWIAFSELYEYKSNKYKTLTEYIFA